MSKSSIINSRIFFHSLRTAIIFVSGFIIYELLVKLEKKWNSENSSKQLYNFSKKNSIKFLLIFVTDFILLYIFYFVFGVYL